jgi:hypothetical protein
MTLYPQSVVSQGVCPNSLLFRCFHFILTFETVKEFGSVSIDIQGLQAYMAKTLCMLEIWWPLTFFDLQIHFIDEPEICGLMGSKWCYRVERYLHALKKYMRNRTKPKSYMASRYMFMKLGVHH